MRICFIGDSFVHGTGDDDGLGWVGRVCARARRSGHDLTAYDLGIRRDTSADVAARWHQEADRRLPDDCDGRWVFSFGVNDCTTGHDGSPRIDPAESLDTLRSILSLARRERPTLMVGPPPVADDPGTNARIAALSGAFDRACASIGVPYLPVFDRLLACDAWMREAATGDGSHPNAGGYEALADIVACWTAWRAWLSPTG